MCSTTWRTRSRRSSSRSTPTSDGNLSSRPVFRDGQPVQCREAVERRDRLIEHLASLAPGAGRARPDRAALRHRPGRRGHRPLAPHRRKRTAPATGVSPSRTAPARPISPRRRPSRTTRSASWSSPTPAAPGARYHADLGARNQRLRVHYLLEAGWKADTAIQGLGRSNRTNQAQPPLFRPVATNVKAEKRFLSTIARRLDTLGAITKGQRQTGGQGLFRAEDNLEIVYARDALRQFYMLLYAGKVEGCSLQRFEDATGLHLTDRDGSAASDELPPITTFLNRLLALTIDLQNTLFEAFEELLQAKIEGAIAAGTYDIGVETITAESLASPSGARSTPIPRPARRRRSSPSPGATATAVQRSPRPWTARTTRGPRCSSTRKSDRAAVQVPAPSLMLDDGTVERRVRLIRPMERTAAVRAALADTHWEQADRGGLRRRLGGGNRRAARVHGERPSTSSPACCCRSGGGCRTTLPRLPPADRRRRARHRPPGLAGLGRAAVAPRASSSRPRTPGGR